MRLIKFLKDWTLIIAIISGIAGYFLFAALPLSAEVHRIVNDAIGILQPALIFSMLFLTFSKVEIKDLRLRKWHLWLLLIQSGCFIGIGSLLIAMPQSPLRVVLEGAMICLICPTATAGAVITRKLGGDVNNITTYTMLINIANALLIPLFVPFVHPNPDLSVLTSALLILAKVFPILLLPLISATVLRSIFPKFIKFVSKFQDLSFYLWAVALSIAIAVTTRSIVNSNIDLTTQMWLVGISLVCCVAQFYLGRKIGSLYDDKVTAGQSFGQKNTVLAIWMGYTFFTPVTAIVGGFYSIWHNVYNSYQLYRHKKENTA